MLLGRTSWPGIPLTNLTPPVQEVVGAVYDRAFPLFSRATWQFHQHTASLLLNELLRHAHDCLEHDPLLKPSKALRTKHTLMQHVLRPTRKRAVIDRAYNFSHDGGFQISKEPTTAFHGLL